MSTENQLKGDSLRRQTDLSEQYAREHNLQLVKNFKLQDIGISAYKGDNVQKGALGKFLEAVEMGYVPKGSYLLVESLDRLSRQRVKKSLSLFLDILENGIKIVTLADNRVYADDAEVSDLVYSILVLSRAHEESQIKSSRVSAAWKRKRENIQSQVLTKMCPAWLVVNRNRDGFDLIEDRVSVIKRIYSLAEKGHGSNLITRILNSDNVKPFGRSNGWNESYVTKILNNRAVLGEFQPHAKVDGKRVPSGDVISDYFPQIVDDDTFLRVQAGRRERRQGKGGRRGTHLRNLFTHLAKCHHCGASMRFIDKGHGPKGGQYLRCSGATRGMNCNGRSWKYQDFEMSVFAFLKEFDLTSALHDHKKRSEFSSINESILIEKERLRSQEADRERIFSLLTDSSPEAEDYLKEKLGEISVAISLTTKKIGGLENNLNYGNEMEPPASDTKDQIDALVNLRKDNKFESRFLISKKLSELIRKIDVATCAETAKFERAKKLVEDSDEKPEFKKKLIDHLEKNILHGPLSDNYFTIYFFDDSFRAVVPEKGNPTKLKWMVETDRFGSSSTTPDGNVTYI